MSSLMVAPEQIWLVMTPVDMRRGIDGLSTVIQQNFDQSPCAGSAFVFRNRTGNRLRLLIWDGNGVWLCQRRLHQGHFIWPKADATQFSLTVAQWQWLIMGIDWQRLHPLPNADWQI